MPVIPATHQVIGLRLKESLEKMLARPHLNQSTWEVIGRRMAI
jgi:hypothetical protein